MNSIIKRKPNKQITFSGEPVIDSDNNLSSQTLFLCPRARIESSAKANFWSKYSWELDSSPHFQEIVQQNESSPEYYKNLNINNHVLPLLWCKNKEEILKNYCGEEFLKDYCGACTGYKNGQYYYFCKRCCCTYHKECVESPPEIKHSYHPKHFLKLFFNMFSVLDCVHCGDKASKMVYHCTLCNFTMHPVCAMKPVSFVIDQPKRHEHPLTFFTRRVSLDCNVCGLTKEVHPTYVCLKCNFVAHKDCANFPSVIRISRHNHHLSFTITFSHREWSCRNCRKRVDSEYGGYICNKCDDYVVHSRCALQENIWDKKELEGVQEEDDIEKNVESFKIISEGMILHFSHEHPLRAETSKVYDERKICEACIIPIYEGDFYSCMECNFILHSTCANAPRRKQYALHPHSLKLNIINGYNDDGFFSCHACRLDSCGFIYKCEKDGCEYKLDVKCASIYEPFNHQGHEHPLFLRPPQDGMCRACGVYKDLQGALKCDECDFIICFSCVNLPQKARYKHDKHFLTLNFGGYMTSELEWCEICEKELYLGRGIRFYSCNYGCNSFHVDCLLGKNPYMKPGLTIKLYKGSQAQILPNYSFSRPICDYCHRRCGDKMIFRRHGKIYCSLSEMNKIVYNISRSFQK